MLYAPYTCDDIPQYMQFSIKLDLCLQTPHRGHFTSQGFSVHFAPHSEVDRKPLAGEDAPRLKNKEYPTHWKKTPIYYHKSREIRK